MMPYGMRFKRVLTRFCSFSGEISEIRVRRHKKIVRKLALGEELNSRVLISAVMVRLKWC